MGGFECASMSFAWTHRFEIGYEADVQVLSGHLERAEEDYGLLASIGMRTVRDAVCWKRVEGAPGAYDWTAFRRLIRAARATGVQVVWDLCHFGLPRHVDPFADDFSERFSAYALAAAEVLYAEGERAPVWCPINEISYWSFAGGEAAHFAPHGRERGHELKLALCRATIGAIDALRRADPSARFLLVDPIMHTVEVEGPTERSEQVRRLQYDAWDIIGGLKHPEVGGRPDLLDIIGVNYYANNQWFLDGRGTLPLDHPLRRRPSDMIVEIAHRYGRPVLVSETGAEGDDGPPWLDYMLTEVEAARRAGVSVEGLCLYPVMDYPGWTDERHCPCGVIEVAPGWGERTLRNDMRAIISGGGLGASPQVPPQDETQPASMGPAGGAPSLSASLSHAPSEAALARTGDSPNPA